MFTAGIGENSASERLRIVQGLEKLGFAIDSNLNDKCLVSRDNPVCNISAPYSSAKILVIATDEELMIARQCTKALEFEKSIKLSSYSKNKRPIRVAVSARHVHLSKNDVALLFGEGTHLTKKNKL